ncbi:MAG: J domain-containing protein [Parvularculaceae bacterium]
MLGKIAILLALVAAAWILLGARKGGGETRNLFNLKLVGLLAIAAVMFAAQLFPLALMILIAAGGVTVIELWRDRAIKGMDEMTPGAGVGARAPLGVDEAAAVLGVAADAGEDEIKAAHKKLIAQLHPDRGGTDYLAAKINDARRVMLEKRGGAKTVSKTGDGTKGEA